MGLWKDTSFEDPDLQSLSSRPQATVLLARAPGTVKMSGGASTAAKSGVGDRVFERHGRWKSVSAKDGYVKDHIASRISVSKTLGF